MKTFPIFFVFLFIFSAPIFGQSQEADWLFDDTSLPEIHISIDPGDLNRILTNIYSDTEYPADFVFIRDGIADTVLNVGFRIRGNTSRASKKKSFKVSFDTFEDGREYFGLDKMNINGEHNDPSIIRSKLSWDVFAAMDVKAPRANHVQLFINSDYYGLYINVEHIDNEFVEDRFGSDAGNLYKALYPSDLTYLGNSPEDYKRSSGGRRIYELKTNEEEDDYTDLANFIIFMRNAGTQEFENQIRDYINVDGVIRVMAVDILTGMWDDYMFNKNNFYLYHNPESERFEFIPYDYDNTFGIDWFGVDWDVRDINNWGSNESRPLTDRIFAIQKYRDRLHFYINKMLNEYFNTTLMNPEIDRLKAMIQDAAEADSFRTLDYGFTIEDFNRSYEFSLGAHVKEGIKGYISTRNITAQNQLNLNNIVPVIESVETRITYGADGAILHIAAKAFDDDTIELTATLNGTQVVPLIFQPADDIFRAKVILGDIAETVSISIEAIDSNQQTERYPFNPASFINVEVGNSSNNVMINEFMASNNSTITDESGAFEDWVELFNPTENEINLSGYYLTDDLSDPTKWAFPDVVISAQNHLLVWTDNDDEEGPLHTNFRLSKSGEDIGLFFNNGSTTESIDAFSYSEQITDVSFGRQTDGSSTFVSFPNPTPGTPNGTDTSVESDLDHPKKIQLYQNYPNPFNPSTTISFSLAETQRISLKVYSIAGREIQTIADGSFPAGIHQINFDASSFASGIYFYKLETAEGNILTQKMTLLK